MKYLRVTDDSTRADLEQAIGRLRAKRQVVRTSEVRHEIGAEVDELIEMWAALG